jgi:citrate lyase subunit beta/citryl-CoA lyase
MLGAEDLALDAGFEPDEETLRLPKQQVVFAAGAAGVAPFGLLGSLTSFDENRDAWREMALRSRRFGFVGATCIHPAQVPIVNEAFTPTDGELKHAARIVRASDEAQREGRGAFAVDGRMVDAPIVQRARRLLTRTRR